IWLCNSTSRYFSQEPHMPMKTIANRKYVYLIIFLQYYIQPKIKYAHLRVDASIGRIQLWVPKFKIAKRQYVLSLYIEPNRRKLCWIYPPFWQRIPQFYIFQPEKTHVSLPKR